MATRRPRRMPAFARTRRDYVWVPSVVDVFTVGATQQTVSLVDASDWRASAGSTDRATLKRIRGGFAAASAADADSALFWAISTAADSTFDPALGATYLDNADVLASGVILAAQGQSINSGGVIVDVKAQRRLDTTVVDSVFITFSATGAATPAWSVAVNLHALLARS